jgi:hypothetical protein
MLKKGIILSIFFFISCSDKKEAISFSLNNNNLKCIVRKDSLYSYRYYNKDDKEFSTNVVSFTLKNETEKKYLFLVKNKYLHKIYNCRMNVYENSKLIKFHAPIGDAFFDNEKKQEKLFNYIEYTFKDEQNKLFDLVKLGAKQKSAFLFNSYLEESLMVNANEKVTINSLLSLPFIVENTILNTMDPVYYEFKENCKYEFSLEYEIDANNLKKELTKEQLNELEYNNVEIFNGKIETERIPILVTFK